MVDSTRPHAVVVGGGFSGVMVAVNLLAQDPHVRVTLVEGSHVPGRGVAYDTPDAAHLLNVPAGRMSAFANAPDHFVSWARSRGCAVDAGIFASRRLYGEYLEDVLGSARTSADGRLAIVNQRATAVTRSPSGRFAVELGATSALSADAVVLALGHAPAAVPVAVPNSRRVILDPWAPGALATLPVDGTVVLLGTGLTMVDVATSLVDRGARKVLAISRRGLLPNGHAKAAADPALEDLLVSFRTRIREAGTLRERFRVVRQTIALAQHTTSGGFREVIDALRSSTPELWASLDPREKERFLRHVRPYWEAVRHRTAPRVTARVEELRRAGVLEAVAARLASVHADEDHVELTLRRRGARHAEHARACALVVCTGASGSVRGAGQGLVGALLDQGLATLDPVGLGLRASADGALLDGQGASIPGLFAAGPLVRGAAYEATAVPELRVQAAAVARAVAQELGEPSGRAEPVAASGVLRVASRHVVVRRPANA